MADSSGHPSDDSKKAAGTAASSSSDETSSSDDSPEDSSDDCEDGARSATTPARGKDLEFQSRLGQGKQLRPVLPTAKNRSTKFAPRDVSQCISLMCSLPMLVTNFQKTLMKYW